MKTIRLILIISLCLFFLATIALADEYPKAVGFVNDFAQVLSKDAAKKLNSELISFEKETSVEIVVVTVTSLDGQDIKSYTIGLATNWGVGKRDKNNGIVLLVAPKERKMRIQTASGIKSILTDSKAEEIRDSVILPRFKAGNMAQGIIEGTQTIMKTIRPGSSGSTDSTENARVNANPPNENPPMAIPKKSAQPKDPYQTEKIIIICMAILVAVAFCIFAIILPMIISHTRKAVFSGQNKFKEMMLNAENIAKNPDVRAETRNKLGIIQTEFAPIGQLLPSSHNVKWINVRAKLNSLIEQLGDLVSKMMDEIAFAQKARKDGPELMKKIPELIASAEKTLAEGKLSEKATKLLDEARQNYIRAQSMQSGGMGMIDWVMLYMLLSSIQSNCHNAQEAHTYANTDHDDSFSSRTETTSSFGESGGLGGGGGFNSGGGGASGEW